MENFNKTLPFLTTIIGFGILVFAIFSFINGVKTELSTRMDRVETKIHNVRTELKADVREVREEIREVRTALNDRMDRVESRMEGIEGKLDQLILLQAQNMPAPKIRRIGPKKVKRKPAQAQ